MNHIKSYNESNSMENIYLKSVEIISDVFPLKAGVKVNFDNSICFIVGDNGVGKSTLLECIRDEFGYKDDTYLRRQGMKKHITMEKEGTFPFKYIDFHGDDRKFAGSFGDNMALQIQQMKLSSGQVSISLLNSALGNIEKTKNGLVILDEPCRGQSIKNKIRLVGLISGLKNKLNCQVIVTTHSDTLLKAFRDNAQYFDISLNSNTTYKDFMISQLS